MVKIECQLIYSVSRFINDAEATIRDKKVMALVMLDFQGAFNALLHKRLLRQMREQGWPSLLCQCVEYFLTQWRICVRHSDGTTQDKVIECGVPQGSPLSSLLFLLYIAFLVENSKNNSRFGYADDIAILTVGSVGRTGVLVVISMLDIIMFALGRVLLNI